METLSDLAAIVLAGGLGTRLRGVVRDLPKVLAPVGGRPFLSYLLEQLDTAGIEQAILCTGYMGDQVESAFGSSYGGIRLTYSHEDEPLGTAGALRHALPMLQQPEALVLNGDSLCRIDFAKLVRWHRSRRSGATVVVAEKSDVQRYGSVELGPNDQVRAFNEKGNSQGSGLVNAGIYLIERHRLAMIPSGRAVSLEREVLPEWLKAGLYAFRSRTTFLDIGTPESLAAASEFLASAAATRRYVLLDRDGTVIHERDHLTQPEQVELLPRAADGLRHLRRLGLGLVLITNQSAVGRRMMDEKGLEAVHGWLAELLRREGVTLDGIYTCPHRSDQGCGCRKPATGLAEQAAEDLAFELTTSFVIGDKECDVELARNIGAQAVLVRTGYGTELAAKSSAVGIVADDLADAADRIEVLLNEERQPS